VSVAFVWNLARRRLYFERTYRAVYREKLCVAVEKRAIGWLFAWQDSEAPTQCRMTDSVPPQGNGPALHLTLEDDDAGIFSLTAIDIAEAENKVNAFLDKRRYDDEVQHDDEHLEENAYLDKIANEILQRKVCQTLFACA